jgi:hypothetical protein
MVVEHCLFERCAHASKEEDAGAVFLMYENPYDSVIAKCAFVANVYNESFTITVASGHTLVITDACFTGIEAREVNLKNVIMEGCSFEQVNCFEVETVHGRAPGFDGNWNGTAEKKSRVEGEKKMSGRLKGTDSGLFLGCVVGGIILAGILTIVGTVLHGIAQPRQKVPKAFE